MEARLLSLTPLHIYSSTVSSLGRQFFMLISWCLFCPTVYFTLRFHGQIAGRIKRNVLSYLSSELQQVPFYLIHKINSKLLRITKLTSFPVSLKFPLSSGNRIRGCGKEIFSRDTETTICGTRKLLWRPIRFFILYNPTRL